MSEDEYTHVFFAAEETGDDKGGLLPIAAYTDVYNLDLFIKYHTRPADIYRTYMPLDRWVEELQNGEVPYEMIVGVKGDLKSVKRLDYTDLLMVAKWSIVSEGVKIHVTAKNQIDALVKASNVLEALIAKGIVRNE